jgi:hypothetical protein
MKPIQIECSNPDAFQDAITVTVTDGYITLECDEVSGTSDVIVTVMKALNPSEGDPPAVTSTEFDILNNRIGNLSSLTTTDKASAVAAVNELNGKIPAFRNGITTVSFVPGTPQTKQINFDSPMPDSQYSVSLTQEDTAGVFADITFGVTSRTANGFVIRSASNRSGTISIDIGWIAIEHI